MDLITIIWYFSTFIALVAFFVVMACSENHCGRAPKPPPPVLTPPPTPAPSYREFAPPGYDTVMKKNKQNRIFIVPVHENDNKVENTISSSSTEIDIENFNQNETVVRL